MDAGSKDLGAVVPRQRSEPTISPFAPPAERLPAAPVFAASPDATRPVFAGDLPGGADALGIDETLAHVAELAAHGGTVAPLCIGVLGGAGCGKSFALGRLVDRVGAIAGAASSAGQGPFLSPIHVQAIDAAGLYGDPVPALAAQIHAGLRRPYPELARDIGQTARDPHLVAREVGDKLDEARRRLDAEQRTLDESGSRRARLTETVLFESAGSHVDAYARANRGRLENRLTAFGIAGDATQNYKNLVRVVAEGGGPLGLSLRALYAYKGQTRLIVLAVLFVLLGIGSGIAIDTQDSWLADLRNAGPQIATTAATWADAHMDLLALLRKAAFALAALMVVANGWRAFGFVQPILTGVRLLRADLAARRHDLDGLYAHQTKRVDGLSADVERLARIAAEAETRLGEVPVAAGMSELPLLEPSVRSQAQDLVQALGRSLRAGTSGAPRRVLLVVDHLDAVAPERARAILEALHRLAAAAALVTIVAFDPQRVDAASSDLDRWVQLPLRLDALTADRDSSTLVLQALGRAAPPAPPPAVDPTRSALDAPIGDGEATLLETLAPLAGTSPRAVKRFLNLYRMARLDVSVLPGPLALMLALDQGGTPAERQVAAEAMGGDDGAAFEPHAASVRLRAAVGAVRALDGAVSRADVARAAARATLFSAAAPV